MSRFSLAFALLLGATLSSPLASAQNACAVGERNSWGDCPIPLRMDAGTYGVAVTGHVTPNHPRVTYALDVRAGQMLTISFTGARDMTGEIGCGNTGDGPWYGSGNTFTAPLTGTCFVSVGENMRAGDPWSGNFTLAVLVK